MKYPDKTVLVYDRGLFVELAIRLARDFGRVLYYKPCCLAFPKSSWDEIGSGIAGVERIPADEFWDVIDWVDLFVFPDIYDGGLQVHLRDTCGKRVWGNFGADVMETDRWGMRRLMKEIGMEIPPTHRVKGLPALRQHLADKKNKFVKIGHYRGDMESFRHDAAHTTEPFLDVLADQMGKRADDYEFLVEDKIEGIEVGYDGYAVDGQFPDVASYGYEIKDLGYIGKVANYADFPEALTSINAKIAPVLKMHNARGFISMEVRVTKDRTPYLVDPCIRCGSPPTEGEMEVWENLAEILWEGAEGKLITPKPTCKYYVIAMIHSEFARDHWTPIEIPPEIRQWVKLKCCCEKDGKAFFVPTGEDCTEIGGVVALGDSLDEAVKLVQERADQVKGYKVEVTVNSIENALKEVEEGKEVGVNF